MILCARRYRNAMKSLYMSYESRIANRESRRRHDSRFAIRNSLPDLLAQEREKDHFPNGRVIGQHHHKTIDSDPDPARGGHPVLEGEEEVLVHLALPGHLVAPRLIDKTFALLD